MKKQLWKNDIHNKALRAAAGVALFGGSFACGEMPAQTLGSANPNSVQQENDTGVQSSNPDALEAPVDTGVALTPDAGVSLDAGQIPPEDTGVALDAGQVPSPDAGMSMDASSLPASDAGLVQCNMEDGSWEAYEKCCAMYNWDPRHGCLAWGPPAPPSASSKAKENA